MFDTHQIKDLITRTLKLVDGMYSEDAVDLLMLTAAVESDLGTYLRQIQGPALGLMQVEPDTMYDCYSNYLDFRPSLRDSISIATSVHSPDKFALESNIAFNILIARIKYFRVPKPIPKSIEGKARYHEKYYNARPNNYSGVEDWIVSLNKYNYFIRGTN